MNKFDTDKFSFFTGIDVSRNKIDFAVVQGSTPLLQGSVPNSETGFSEMIDNMEQKNIVTSKNLFCMEATGIYINPLLDFCSSRSVNVCVEHAERIKNSSGMIRNKSDKLDALRIANYAQRFIDQLKPWLPKRPVISQLQHLSTLRRRLVVMQASFKASIKENTSFLSPDILRSQLQIHERARKALESEVVRVDKLINRHIKNDKIVSEKMAIMTSIPGVGPVTALEVLIATNEFKNIRCPKKFASYAGVAPMVRESGTKKWTSRTSRQSDQLLKSLLTTCAFSAIQYLPELKVYYKRKTIEEKKPKMLVINAVRYKIILRIFCCINTKRRYDPEYRSALIIHKPLTTTDRD